MSRSVRKGPSVASYVIDKISQMNLLGDRNTIQTWSRSTTILPMMVGHTFAVHNGCQHVPVFVVEDMVGYKLGEFAPTRKFRSHLKKDKRKNKNGLKNK
jgi:small subunit ribosomal protein S19